MEAFEFFKIFIKNPSSVGSLIPSSQALAKMMFTTAKAHGASVIVEFGTGTGVFTEYIQKNRAQNSHFFPFEIEPNFAEMTQKRCPDIRIWNMSAVHTLKILKEHDLEHCDCIISGLPWATLPAAIQHELFEVMFSALAPDGIFVTFGYMQSACMPSIFRFRKKLNDRFLDTGVGPWVWGNFPPARAYWAIKGKGSNVKHSRH